MTDYEQYLLDKLSKMEKDKHNLEVEVHDLKQLIMKESRETAQLRKLNHELSTQINYLQGKYDKHTI